MTYRSGWYELPIEVDANKDGRDDNNSDYYYAHHLCAGGEKNAQRNGSARNFTVCFSANHHCPVWVAAPRHSSYESGASRTDAYAQDPQIPSDIQYKSKSTGGGCNKGHMLGSAERLSSTATNKQVFYYSNIAPQHSTYFNTGGGAWNTLEEWVDKQWVGAADTTYQVIGCYWDPAESPKQVSGTTIPTHYYKVLLRTKNHKNKWVVECSKDELQCIAVMVEHRTYEKSEVPKPADYEKKGMFLSVKEMEELTGLTFFGNVPNAPKESYNVSDWTF